MENNQLRLTGTLAERKELRYTPGGVPLIECRISHQSQQTEAGRERQVMVAIFAVAIGDLAHQVQRLTMSQPLSVTGFLAQKSQNSQHIVLHICSLENI
ncbi:MAG: primosomal replication protein N [Sulfuriferula sp.]